LNDPESISRGFGPKCGNSSVARNSVRITYATEKDFVSVIKRADPFLVFGAVPKHIYVHANQCILVKTDLGRDANGAIGATQNESEVEYTSNYIADILDMSISPYGYVTISDRKYFATKLFSRDYNKKTKSIDVLGQPMPIADINNDSSEFLDILGAITKTSKTPTIDTEKFIQMVIYDALIANADRHNENISMLQLDEGTYLSPMYDNVSCIGTHLTEKDLPGLKGKITVGNRRGGMIDYLKGCDEVSEGFTRSFCEKILLKKADILGCIDRDISDPSLRNLMSMFIEIQTAIVKDFLAGKKEGLPL
jgi:hypothetical protein